jgi:hypothetical protein
MRVDSGKLNNDAWNDIEGLVKIHLQGSVFAYPVVWPGTKADCAASS